MRILGIFILILLLTTSFNALLDLVRGLNPSHVLFHLLNPFWVIETGEYVMLGFFLLLTIGQQIRMIIKNKGNKQNSSS